MRQLSTQTALTRPSLRLYDVPDFMQSVLRGHDLHAVTLPMIESVCNASSWEMHTSQRVAPQKCRKQQRCLPHDLHSLETGVLE